MPAPRTLEHTLREIRRMARGAQRRATRLPELGPLVARILASSQTLAIEKRHGGIAIRLRLNHDEAREYQVTCVIHDDEALPLTSAEREVAQQLCDGRTLAQIGRLRGVSVNTIKSQVRQIFRKLDVETRVALVRRLCA